MNDTLIDRLRGIYKIPITDNLGPVGDDDDPKFFIRKFESTPICLEAAEAIENLQIEIIRLRSKLYPEPSDYHDNLLS